MPTNVDVLIVTALKTEFEAARKVFLRDGDEKIGVTQWETMPGDRPYICGRYLLDDGSGFDLAIARPNRMGANSTGSLAAALVERLRPLCLAMTGVCAGNPEEVALGDVVVGELAYAYDEGKRDAEGFTGDHRQSPIAEAWLTAAQDLDVSGLRSYGLPASDDARFWFLERLRDGADPRKHPARNRYFAEGKWKIVIQQLEAEGLIKRQGTSFTLLPAGLDFVEASLAYDIDPPAHLPFAVKVGPIASGNAVVKDGVTWDTLKRMGVRTVIGLEMEAAAIGIAARAAGVPYWMVVKGVMDHADPKKDDRFKAFGARASAEVLELFLQQQAGIFARKAPATSANTDISVDWLPRSPMDPEFALISSLLGTKAPRFRAILDRSIEVAKAATNDMLEAHRVAEAIKDAAGHKIDRAKTKPFHLKNAKVLKLKKITGNKRDGAKVWDSGDEYVGQIKGETESGIGVYRVFHISSGMTPTLASSYAGKVDAGYGPSGVYTFPDRAQFMGEWSGGHPSFGYRELVGASNSLDGDLYLGSMSVSGSGGYTPRWFPEGEGILINAGERVITCGTFKDGELEDVKCVINF